MTFLLNDATVDAILGGSGDSASPAGQGETSTLAPDAQPSFSIFDRARRRQARRLVVSPPASERRQSRRRASPP